MERREVREGQVIQEIERRIRLLCDSAPPWMEKETGAVLLELIGPKQWIETMKKQERKKQKKK
jgi:hypothetical protein